MDVVNTKYIEKKVIVDCPIDKVWWMWTTHEGLLSFFGPANDIDFKIGGKYEIYFLMDNPPGLRGGEGNTILSYSPQEMLSFTWNAPPEFPVIRNHTHKTWVVVHFKPLTERTTNVNLKHLGWLDGSEWDEVYHYFEAAWDTVFLWLRNSCKK